MNRVARFAPLCGPALAATVALAAPSAHAQATPPASAPSPTELSAISVHPRTEAPMHFLAYRGEDQYTVQVQNQQCTTPCTLVLTSGPTTLRTSGAGELTTQLVVPHYTGQVRLYAGAPGWYLPAGAALIPGGIVVASSFWAFGLACGGGSGRVGCQVANFAGWPVVGISMLIAGSVLVGVANRSAPVDSNRVEILDARARPRMRLTDFALGPTQAGFGGAASFTF